MKTSALLLILLGISGPSTRAQTWISLFDGKTMRGWEDPRLKNPPGDSWTVEDGCLKACRNPRITEDLFTLEKFTNFELEFEWRISPGANSGVKYRIQDRVFLAEKSFPRFEDLVNFSMRNRPTARPARGQEYVIGFEYQVIDNQRHGDARRGPKYQAASVYDMAAPDRDATRPPGEFNSSRLLVRGDRAEHWLNGVRVLDVDLREIAQGAARRWGAGTPVYELLVEQPVRTAPISLQNHGDDAWFRNIRIRPLP